MADKVVINGRSLSFRKVFESNGETEEFEIVLPLGRGHQYTLDVACDDWTGQQLDLYLRGIADGKDGRAATAVASLERPVYQKRSELTDRASTDPIVANGLYDVRGDAAFLVIKATIVATDILVDVHQLVG